MKEMYNQIRNFWDRKPCGTTHIPLATRNCRYFNELDQHYMSLYPYLLPFIDLETLQGKCVLEIGIGSGFTLSRIAPIAKVCVGLDISGETLKLNQSRNELFKTATNLVLASATHLPLPDNTFDVVVSIGCLHHIPDINQAVSEIHRVLKPGGVFKGMVYNRNSYRFRIYIPLAQKLSSTWRGKDRLFCVNEMYDGPGNPYGRVYSKGEIKALFNRFKDVTFRRENFVGSELLPKIGAYIPRRFWLATFGKILGLDLYFFARAVKS